MFRGMGSNFYDWDELYELDRKRQEEEDKQFFWGCAKFLIGCFVVLVIIVSTILWICLG